MTSVLPCSVIVQGLPTLVPLDVELNAQDTLEQAGVVLSVLEGVVVVQGLENSAALAEG